MTGHGSAADGSGADRPGRLRASRKRHGSRVERALFRKVGEAIADFDLIRNGDRILVALSGGKDSYALLAVLAELRRRAPVGFELHAVNIDQGWPGHRGDIAAKAAAEVGVELEMARADIASVVDRHQVAGATPCSICSRLRRGFLYSLAARRGYTKIALGHHLDDLAETLLLNLFYSGKLATMPPYLCSDDGRNVVIRPLCYVPEQLIVEFVAERGFEPVRCACPVELRGDQKRQAVKRLLGQLEQAEPGTKYQMLAALKNPKPSHLLDRRWWPVGGSSRPGADREDD